MTRPKLVFKTYPVNCYHTVYRLIPTMTWMVAIDMPCLSADEGHPKLKTHALRIVHIQAIAR